MQKKRIAILGAGPMGLAVAYQLIKDGYMPIIYEADDRIGGMAASFDFDGIKLERYYHFHCTSDFDVFDVLEELGLSAKLHWINTKMGFFYLGELQEWGNPIALLKFKGLNLIDKIRFGLHAFYCTKVKNWKSLDKKEASTWIKWWVGEKAFNVVWGRLLEYKFYQYSTKLSAAWVGDRVKRLGSSRQNIMKEKLGFFEDGTDTLLDSLKKFIEENGGTIKLSSPVSKVMLSNGKLIGIEANDSVVEYDKVISTIPLPFVPKIIPDLPNEIKTKYEQIDNIAVVCAIVKLSKNVSSNFWLNINDQRMDIPGIIEYSNLRPMKENIIYVPFYLPGEHPNFLDADSIFVQKVKSYLMMINKSLKEEDFLKIKISRYRYAQPICTPGFLNNLPPLSDFIEGLWIADTSYYYPADRGISESFKLGKIIAKKVIGS